MLTSARLGCRNGSPINVRPWTASAASVASDSASCVTRRSGQRRLSTRPPISRPTHTETLERINAALPAARLAIQYRCGPVAVASGPASCVSESDIDRDLERLRYAFEGLGIDAPLRPACRLARAERG